MAAMASAEQVTDLERAGAASSGRAAHLLGNAAMAEAS